VALSKTLGVGHAAQTNKKGNKMKKLILVTALLLTGYANAAIDLQLQLGTGYTDGLGRVNIAQADNGELSVVYDPNHCRKSSGGMICTRMAVFHYTIDPEIVRDDRPVDGPLILALKHGLHLSIGSGHTPDGKIYVSIIKKYQQDGQMHYRMSPKIGYPRLF